MSRPIDQLCAPVDPVSPITLSVHTNAKTKKTYELRTICLPSDIEWIIAWTGAALVEDLPGKSPLRQALENVLSHEARSPFTQSLVATEDGRPKLLITVHIEILPFRTLTSTNTNYVWYLHTEGPTESILPVELLKESLRGCFQFDDVNRIFACLDSRQRRLEPYLIKAGLKYHAPLTESARSGYVYYEALRNKGANL